MHTSLDIRAIDLFRAQAGVLTRAQATQLGYSSRQITYRLGTNQWINLRRGIYRHRAFDVSPEMAIFALTLANNGFASHRYAARLHGLEPELWAAPEVTVRRGTHLKPGVDFPPISIHESTQIGSADLMEIDGIAVSGVARTIMDVAAVEPRRWWILALIDSAKRKGLVDDLALETCLKRHARRGRDGTVRFREAVSVAAASGTPAIGHSSRQVAAMAANRGLPYPFLEEPVFGPGGDLIAQTDLSFVVPVVGFLDGYGPHKSRSQMNRDRSQRQRLRDLGLWVFEFTWDQITKSPGYVSGSLVTTYRRAERAAIEQPVRYEWWTRRRSPVRRSA
ncbi:MAG: type IV toxin-antitoxin system AbiEi family antitoxin domain-containing protein [Acidimicrobiales bacterium]